MQVRRAVALGALGLACGACGSDLKMHVGTPLTVKRGYLMDFTRFEQNDKEVNRRDVKEKLARRTPSGAHMSRADTQETVGQVLQVPATILLLLGLAPSQQADFSTGTRVGLLGGAVGLVAASCTFYAVAESNYVTAVERYNASLPGNPAVLDAASTGRAAPKRREAFPSAVGGFSFGMQLAEAQSACLAQGSEFAASGKEARCARTSRSRPNVFDVRLRLPFGAVTEIVFEYRPPAEQLNTQYSVLAAGLRDKYGPPQVEPEPLSEACRASLTACLADSAQKPIVWSWARGSIGVLPVLRGERAQIELSYIANETPP